jgi:uncharacterized glyoxalase superfamily protein PhnB
MSKVKPVPEGYHTITAHIVVRDTKKAIEFYQRAFGAQELASMPAPDGKTIMHAEIKIGSSMLMLAEEYPQMGSLSPLSLGGSGVTMHLYVEDVDAAFQRALDAGATVKMPVADMFWGDRFGMLSDPFGHQWSIASRTQDMTLEELAQASEKAFASNSAFSS